MNETVLVVVAHPDDEVLGCGGTMARHASNGDRVHVLFAADGETSRIGIPSHMRRHEAAQQACKILSTEPPTFLDLPDQRLDSISLLDVIQKIEPIITVLQPDIVYTHHGGDLNSDHRIVHQAVLTALRPQPGSVCKGLFALEVPSSTEWASTAIGEAFRPSHFVNIGGFLDLKMKALQAYDAEMREFPHARSYTGVKSLATLRGVSIGFEAAEAFVPLRTLVR